MKTLKDLINEANDENEEENHEKVINMLTDEVLEKHADEKLYKEIGYAWYRTHDCEKALLYYNKRVELLADADAHFWVGEALLQLDKHDEALPVFEKAIELKYTLEPKINLAFIYSRKALCLSHLDQQKESIKFFTKSLKMDPEQGMTHYNRGCVYMDLGQYQKAIADFDKAIEQDPEDTGSYLNRARCHEETGNNQKAMEDLNKLLSIDDTEGDAYNNRGVIWGKIGQHQRAIKDLNKALATDPEKAHYYVVRGNVYADMKQVKEAMADYDKALELDATYELAVEAKRDLKKKMIAMSMR